MNARKAFRTRSLRHLRRASHPFSEMHGFLRRIGANEASSEARRADCRRHLAEALASLAVEVFRLREEARDSSTCSTIESSLDELDALLEMAAVETWEPRDAIVTDDIMAKVEVLGFEYRPGLRQPIVSHVDRPVVTVFGRTFRGAIRVYEPVPEATGQ